MRVCEQGRRWRAMYLPDRRHRQRARSGMKILVGGLHVLRHPFGSALAATVPCAKPSAVLEQAVRAMREHDRLARRRWKRTGFVAALAVAALTVATGTVAAPAAAEPSEISRAVADLYSSVSIYPPSATSMTVCYGFVCRRRHILEFTATDRAALTRLLKAGRANAAAERAAVQKAVVWFDRRMGPILGTNKRVAKANISDGDDAHNYDCWDTTRNTTSLLLLLQRWGLLKFHSIGDPKYRGNVLMLQTPHNTAVLVDRASKVEWAIDLWPRSYLQPPDVMTVERWVTEN
jgi:hypothetical protein